MRQFFFFVVNFCHCEKENLEREYPVTNSAFQKTNSLQNNSPEITTTAYSMKGCLRFFHFHILYRQIWLNFRMMMTS